MPKQPPGRRDRSRSSPSRPPLVGSTLRYNPCDAQADHPNWARWLRRVVTAPAYRPHLIPPVGTARRRTPGSAASQCPRRSNSSAATGPGSATAPPRGQAATRRARGAQGHKGRVGLEVRLRPHTASYWLGPPMQITRIAGTLASTVAPPLAARAPRGWRPVRPSPRPESSRQSTRDRDEFRRLFSSTSWLCQSHRLDWNDCSAGGQSSSLRRKSSVRQDDNQRPPDSLDASVPGAVRRRRGHMTPTPGRSAP